MPNYCSNSLQVTGSENDMKSWYDTMNKPDENDQVVKFSFHQTVPSANRESAPLNMVQLLLSPNSILPNIDNWGVKSDLYEETFLKEEPTEFLVQFVTAWRPPTIWLNKVSKKFPTLTFRLAYCEQGVGFYGMTRLNSSKRLMDHEEHNIVHETDLRGYALHHDENDKEVKVYDFDPNKEEVYDYEPIGSLKTFMENYSIRSLGG